jgi:methyl-accepting chemotaxis protein
MIRLDIRTRLYFIIGIFAVGLAITSATLVYQTTNSLRERRYEELKYLVQSVVSLIASQHASAKAGQLSEADAKARALDLVGKIRYQGDNYFWINDSHPRVVMHPIRKDLDGKDVSGLKDPNGKALFVEFVAVAKAKGAGVVDYMWPKPGSDQPVEKSSYIALFEPWGWIVGTGVYNDDLITERNRAIAAAAVAGTIVTLLIGGIAFLFIRVVTGGLASLTSAMLELARGNFGVVLPGLGRKDEIGDIAGAVEAFKVKAAEKAQLEADEMLRRQKAEAEAEVRSQARIADERGKAAELQAKITDEQARAFRGLAEGLGRLAKGELTFRLTDGFTDDYKEIKDDFNTAISQLQEAIKAIADATSEVGNASSEIATATTDLSQRTEEQAASIEQTSASMEQISGTVNKNADNAQQANQSAAKTREIATRGGEVVAKAVEAMSLIEGSSQKIADIISVIDEIARQTNLLALNAAVEAARAGDAGRGFAVVASEVRSLAQRSSQAAKDITGLITSSSSQVKDGVDLVNRAGQSLSEIVSSIAGVADIVSDIAAASLEQANGIDQINKALTQMDEMTQQNSALVEQNSATAKTLEKQAAVMNERIASFKLDVKANRKSSFAVVAMAG